MNMAPNEKQNLKLLIVDDDEDDVLILKDLIQEGVAGFQIELSHSPSYESALSKLESSSFDLCMFDYRLGEVDGIHLLKKVREMKIEVPIILLTGQGDQEIAVKAMKAGATDYLVKGQLDTDGLQHSISYAVKLTREADRRKRAEELLRESHQELIQKNDKLEDSLKKLKSAQNQIMRSEKLAGVGRLAAGVCHEILNPLNIISGHVQALQMERPDDKELNEDFRSINEEIYRVEKIIGGLLKFSRKGDMEFRLVDINAELESVLAIIEKELSLGNITVRRKFAGNTPNVLIDPDRMRQVFLNIINNAKYAMEGGGVFTVHTLVISKDRRRRNLGKTDDDGTNTEKSFEIPFLRIKFEDTGTGVKKEDMDKMFDPFFTTKPEDKGTGLGLSVCYSIIEKHSGSLEVESEWGKGAAFIIDLPINETMTASSENNLVEEFF